MESVCLPAQSCEAKSSQLGSYSVQAFEHNQIAAINQCLIPVIDILPAQHYAKIDIRAEEIHRSTHYEIYILACWPEQRIINLLSLTLIVRDLTPRVNRAANRESSQFIGIPLPALTIRSHSPQRFIRTLEGILGQDACLQHLGSLRRCSRRNRRRWHLRQHTHCMGRHALTKRCSERPLYCLGVETGNQTANNKYA